MRSPGKGGVDFRGAAGFGFERQIAGHVVVQQRRAGSQRLVRAHYARQVAVFDFDESGRVLCGRRAVGDDQRDRFADEPHFAVSEHRALRRPRLHAVAPRYRQRMRRPGITRGDRVGAGKHLLDAGMRERRRRLERHDVGMRAVGAHEIPVQLARNVPVGRVLAGAGDQAPVFDAVTVMVMRVMRVVRVVSSHEFLED